MDALNGRTYDGRDLRITIDAGRPAGGGGGGYRGDDRGGYGGGGGSRWYTLRLYKTQESVKSLIKKLILCFYAGAAGAVATSGAGPGPAAGAASGDPATDLTPATGAATPGTGGGPGPRAGAALARWLHSSATMSCEP